MKVALLKKNKPVFIDVGIGLAERGSYLVSWWDDANSEWKEIGKGNSWDGIEDKFATGISTAQLNGVDLGWKIGIIKENPGEFYHASFRILQDDEPVEGGAWVYENRMKPDETFARIRGLVRLVVT
jgi:hypothetical protein